MQNHFTLVVATDKNGNIGKDNQLPWRLPSDLKWFKTVTSGGVVIMGRKTFESIGRPLPDRVNVVISKSPVPIQWVNDVIWVNSIDQARQICQTHYQDKASQWFVIGGGEIYRQFMPYADSVLLTEVDAEVSGDTQFPALPESDWETVQGDFTYGITAHPKDEYAYRRKLLKRKSLPYGRFKIFDSSESAICRHSTVDEIEFMLQPFLADKVRFGEALKSVEGRIIDAVNPSDKLASWCRIIPENVEVQYSNIVSVTLVDRVVVFADVVPLRIQRLDSTFDFIPRMARLGCGVCFITVDIAPVKKEISDESNPT